MSENNYGTQEFLALMKYKGMFEVNSTERFLTCEPWGSFPLLCNPPQNARRISCEKAIWSAGPFPLLHDHSSLLSFDFL